VCVWGGGGGRGGGGHTPPPPSPRAPASSSTIGRYPSSACAMARTAPQEAERERERECVCVCAAVLGCAGESVCERNWRLAQQRASVSPSLRNRRHAHAHARTHTHKPIRCPSRPPPHYTNTRPLAWLCGREERGRHTHLGRPVCGANPNVSTGTLATNLLRNDANHTPNPSLYMLANTPRACLWADARS
jgi:hypothetical protein